MPILKKSEGRRELLGNRKKEGVPVIRFHTDRSAVTITFSTEESTDVKAVILDILTEAYRERLQREPPYAKAG